MQNDRTYLYGLAGDIRKIRTRRGFTLIEMAIVATIIGTIVFSVFAAASAVRYRNQVNQGLAEISIIVSNMRSLYAGQNISTAANANTITFAKATPTLVQQMIFPAEMLTPPLPTTGIPVANTVANNPWAPGGSAQIQLVAANPVQFTLRFLSIPANVCVDLIVRNSLPGADTGLMQIKVNNKVVGITGNVVTPLPIDPNVAASTCPTGATYTIDWYYTLGS